VTSFTAKFQKKEHHDKNKKRKKLFDFRNWSGK